MGDADLLVADLGWGGGEDLRGVGCGGRVVCA